MSISPKHPTSSDRKAAEKIEKSMIRIILTQPFFAMLLVRLDKKPDPSVTTMATDGKTIKYNPSWVNKLSLDDTTFNLFHEVLHPALKHHTRRGNRDPYHWNIACDHVVNQALEDSGFPTPAVFLQPNPKYKGMSTEEIYHQLMIDNPRTQPQPGGSQQQGQEEGQDPQGQDGPSNDPGEGGGEVRDFPGDDPAEIAEHEAELEVAVNQAAQVAKVQGKSPGFVDRLIEEYREPRVDWKKELLEFLIKNNKDDYSWRRPNRRHVANNIYLPSMQSDGFLDEIVVAVDTSGSIDATELNLFAAEMTSIMEGLKANKMTVVFCDSSIGNVQEFGPDDMPLQLKPKGGGGTSFAPTMEHVSRMDSDPSCIVYFTDGYCSTYGKDPLIPVLWISVR